MVFSSSMCLSQISLKIDCSGLVTRPCITDKMKQRSFLCQQRNSKEIFGKQYNRVGSDLQNVWSFWGGSTIMVRRKLIESMRHRNCARISASLFTTSQIAGSAFPLGTLAVLPYYALMVMAPKSELTKKFAESSIPYIVLGLLYTSLLCLSWTPTTLQLVFGSKYYLPELPGIANMFSSEMTLASAWIHLLVVDLFAARQVFYDGLKNNVETRHSVSLCLLSCPIGIITHIITKAVTRSAKSTKHGK